MKPSRLIGDPEKIRAWNQRGRENAAKRQHEKPRKPVKRGKSKSKRRPISPASDAQRAKVKGKASVAGGVGECDPAHLWPRSLGGCDHPDCVVPLIRPEHNAYDDGELDLLPHLIREHTAELQHALGHAKSPLRLLERLTGQKWHPKGDS